MSQQNENPISDMIKELYTDPEFLKMQEQRREYVRSLIAEYVPQGHENEYCIQVIDRDLVDAQIVALNEDGSDKEILVDGFPAKSCYPINVINWKFLPLGFIPNNLDISIEKSPNLIEAS